MPRRSGLRLVHSAPEVGGSGSESGTRGIGMETKVSPADYARHLRAIGQDLEARQHDHFNIEVIEDAYVVWVKPAASMAGPTLLRIGKSGLQKLWRSRDVSRPADHERSDDVSPDRNGLSLRYSIDDLDRIEREQRARRSQQNRGADGHRLSQLLRTVGDLVERKHERLLGIAWQDLSVGVVVETSAGRKEIDVFRPDNLYDLWVKMYLRRGSPRAFETPRS